MINIVKVGREEINEYKKIFKIDNNSDIYLIKLNNQTIGYGLLDVNNKGNIIYMSISSSYRSNGYGKKLFKYLLEEIKKIGINKVELKISKENSHAKKIIYSVGGIHLSSTEKFELYVIPIK